LNPFDILLPIGIILPLLAGSAFFFFGWLFESERAALASLVVLVSLVTLVGQVALAVNLAIGEKPPFVKLFAWSPLPNAQVQVAFRADSLSLFFALPLAILVFLVAVYLVSRQPASEEGDDIIGGRLYGLLLLTEGTALGAFYSADLIWLYGWGEVVGLCLYLLAGPGLRGASSERSSFQAYVISVLGGFLIFAPLLVAVSRNGGVSLYTDVSPSSFEVLFFALVLAGVALKTAQFPFQSWLGALNGLPAAAYAFITAGAIFPLAVYIPARLQNIVGDRFNFYQELMPALLPVGAVTILVCGWLAIRELNLTRKVAFVTAGQFGFVLIALGLGEFAAASWQIFSLTLTAPLLWLCADLMQIGSLPPRKPADRSPAIPISRPPRYRALLVLLYLIGTLGMLGLPLSPVYAARWQVFAGLLDGNYRFYLGLAIIGLITTLVALSHGLVSYLDSPRQTIDGRNLQAWVALAIPLLLGLGVVVLGFYPALATDWVAQLPAAINPNGPQKLAVGALSAGGWFGLLTGLGLLILFGLFLMRPSLKTVAVYNGGALYGLDVEEARKRRESQKKSLLRIEDTMPSGFDDDFFKIGTEAVNQPASSYARSGPEPHLTPADYFGPLTAMFQNFYRALDTSFSGSLLGGVALRVLRFVAWLLEWMTEKFYAALAALIVLLFIILLTR